MRVHFIAIGGAAMHNLAIALKINGFEVTGSDDLIAEPSKTRLLNHQLLPAHIGWDANLITPQIDAIILGMHARIDNPELLRAQELGIKIYSYPDYIYQQALNKTRIVVGGSHGKTTITSMILHVLNHYKKDFDYLVGAQIDGFDNMVKLSDAPIIVIEGDEYLASPIDRRPKFHIYKPHVAIISGIAWDHINVFPTFENYVKQFDLFINTIAQNGTLIYCAEDKVVDDLVNSKETNLKLLPYITPNFEIIDGQTFLANGADKTRLQIFGRHNLLNLNAAKLACNQIGINDDDFYEAIKTFTGAAKRLEVIGKNTHSTIFKDFAHSPSKLVATIAAVKEQYPERKLIACLELHTFSSLNKEFLYQYKNTMNQADTAIIYLDNETFTHKGLKPFTTNDIKVSFNLNNVILFNNKEEFCNYLYALTLKNNNLLMMSSGNFGSLNLKKLTGILLDKSL
ncbi:MAG: peptidoglycan synthetase [Sphingobacteriales bacterium]|nr:MAG: peptidoglycan synthetase [Sphingobacteriales bacterium]